MEGESLLTKNNVTIEPCEERRNNIPKCQSECHKERRSERGQSPSWRDIWPQIAASCVALSVAIQAGIGLSYSAVLIPQLAQEESIGNFTKVEASWIASVTAIATPVGALVMGPVMDLIGRKTTCILASFPLLVSWIIMAATQHTLWPLYLARSFVGFGSGMTTAALVYTVEVSHVEFRSFLLCLNSVFVAFGILLTTVLGVILPWRLGSLAFGSLAALSLLLNFFIPESPYWLVHFRNSPARNLVAKRNMKRLNPPDWLFEQEWKRLENSAEKREVSTSVTWLGKVKHSLEAFVNRSCLAPLGVLLMIFFLQQVSGVYVIIFYAVNIFAWAGGDFGFGIDEYSATMMLGALRFSASVLAALLSRRVGRRTLLIVSSLGMAASALFAGISLRSIPPGDFLSTPVDSSSSSWATLASMLLFVTTGALGQMVVPWTLIGELLPVRVRGIGSGLVVSYAYVLMFLVIKTFPFLLDYMSISSIFFFYSGISAASIIYTYFCLPETFGKSIDEIAKCFEKSSKPPSGN